MSPFIVRFLLVAGNQICDDNKIKIKIDHNIYFFYNSMMMYIKINWNFYLISGYDRFLISTVNITQMARPLC